MSSIVINAKSLIGGAIGWFVGGPIGGAIGFGLGGGFSGDTVVSPSISSRPMDLKIQTATYGNPIPQAFGTVRMAGNIIWAQDVLETAITNTQDGGGKGAGGGPSQTTTTYSYSVSFAVGLCSGPIGGITRIWANGQLIYDARATSSVAAYAASKQFAGDIRVYTGTATQNADSLIQASVGAANCPAFRNLAYVVFDTMQLAAFNARTVPNIEVEVVTTTLGPTLIAGTAVGNETLSNSGFTATFGEPSNGFSANRVDEQGMIKRGLVGYVLSGGAYFWQRKNLRNIVGTIIPAETLQIDASSSVPTQVSKVAKFSPGDIDYNVVSSNGAAFVFVYLDWITAAGETSSGFGFSQIINPALKGTTTTAYILNSAKFGSDLYLTIVETTGVGATSYGIYYVDLSQPILNMTYLRDADASVFPELIYCDANFWYGIKNNAVRKYTRASTSLVVTVNLGGAISQCQGLWRVEFGWIYQIGLVIHVLGDDGTDTNVGTVRTSGLSTIGNFYYGNGALAVTDFEAGASPYTLNTAWYAVVNGATTAPTVASIVQSICTTAGLVVGDLDTSQLTMSCNGYIITRQMTGRAAIEPLMPAFYFESVETDNVIRFVARASASVATIIDDDLGAHSGGSKVIDPLEHTRLDEAELPRRTEVTYLSQAAAYQQGSQAYEHKVARSQNQVQIQLPIVLTDAAAAGIAEVNGEAAWMQRNQFKFKTSPKYLYLDPSDVVTVVSNGITNVVRLTKVDTFVNPGVISFESASEDATIYNPAAQSQAVPIPAQVVTLTGPTDAALLDIPLLRDQDDYLGFYLAMCGYLAAWPGAQLFASIDGGQSFETAQNGLMLPAGSSMGVANNALAAVSSGRYETVYWDQSLSVTLVNGTLSSCTLAQLYNWANVIAVGGEVLQFLNATLTGTKTYTLTGLLRGRLGTGTSGKDALHVINEPVVVLSASTVLKVRDGPTNLNAAQTYKPVTLGQTLQATNGQTFTNTGTVLKPLPVSQLGGGRNAALDLLVAWNRNTRYLNVMQSFVGAALGEASESYDVDIIKAGAAVRTIAASSPNATYTAAQQVTDFGSAQSSITIKVYQKSAVIGRGYPTQATI